jgi:acetolactate synthase-1/2/3 large subunit
MNKPHEPKLAAVNGRWHETGADEWSDAVVAAMKLGGVDHLFFVSGTELTYYQEAVAKAEAKGWPTPKLVTMLQESVALHAAIGASMVSGKPSAAAAHVDVGTFHYGAAITTAWRSGAPVLVAAGAGPRAYPGTMRGSRDHPVQWLQEVNDQGQIVRQYTKTDHRMEHLDNPGFMVSRLLQLAMSEPRGPVYLSIPRETAMLPMPGTTRFPTRDQLGVARPAAPTQEDARTIARWLVKSENPCVCVERLGRSAEAIAELVRLAELLALPVMDAGLSDRMNFPTSHALAGTGPRPAEADVVLVLESIRPWSPEQAPVSDAKVAWIGSDPVVSRNKTSEFCADLWITAGAAEAVRAIHEAATGMLDKSDLSRIADRRKRLEERKKQIVARNAQLGEEAARQSTPTGRLLGYELGKLLKPDTIVFNDAVSNAGFVDAYAGRERPGTYFRSGSSSGGWGTGASIGAKVTFPDREVVHATGDGFYIFGSPVATLMAAVNHKAAYLTVVFANRSYHTGTTCVQQDYPDGYSAKAGYEGGTFASPDFAKLAESVGAYGQNVTETADVGPALKRGLEQVRKGVPAVVAVSIPGPQDGGR